ncbi:MAG: trans-aconitate 2-methyltransferase [Myxococcales bacterium]|jgi:SAM-dependent methyltransferase|nr:trans-aconitate 2-methyltransferase [Myxococcales bacterium]
MADADTYTFGDNDLAAERLRILARAFEPTSRAFLADVWTRSFGATSGLRPDHAVDLGCGPGYTTRLIREVMSPTLTTGLDRSPRFLARAQLWQAADLRFVAHDVSAGPFPVAGADIFYARFLLTHLAAPGAVLSTWAQAAAPGAHLLLEETARLASPHAALAQYYTLVAALQRAHGQNMTIGQTLDRLAEGTGWEVQRSRLTTARLPARLMARIHVMNLRTWKGDRLAAGLCDPAALEELDGALERLACGREATEPVDCQLKQLWLRRATTAPPLDLPRPTDAAESAVPPGD